MRTRTSRFMKLGLKMAVFAGLFVAANAVPGVATTSSGFSSTPLTHGYLASGSLRVKQGGQIVVQKNDIVAGGYSGWHSHPGGAIVVVESGQLTTYKVVRNEEAEDGAPRFRCVSTTYTAGKAFVEGPGEPLIAVNTGKTPAVTYATFPGVPVNAAGMTLQRTDEPQPIPDPCPY